MATIKAGRIFCAFLDLIAASEGTCSHPLTRADGYDVIVSGVDGHHIFTDYSTHPFALGRPPVCVRASIPPLLSTASGRYQLIWPTWEALKGIIHAGTFSPQNQDFAALRLLDECHASDMIRGGKIDLAIYACNETWASFPGNLYKQGGKPIEWLLETYATLLEAQGV